MKLKYVLYERITLKQFIMSTQLLKTIQGIAFICVLLLSAGCSKNTIILEFGKEEDPSGENTPAGTTLVTFNASIEGRNLLTRAMSPMNEGIQNQLFAFKAVAGASTSSAPFAEGLYITSTPGVLTGSDGYKMFLTNGVYNFYAVSDNFSTIPPKFTAGKSEPLFNGIDYLWWHNSQLDVTSNQINIPILYLHTATQVVIEVSAGAGIKLDRLLSATITPPLPGASMDLATGTIPPTSNYDRPDKMGINGSMAQYIMLPLTTTTPMSLTIEVMVNGERSSRTYNVQVPVPDGALKAGNSYLFEAVINSNTISFDSVSIKNWTEVDETGKPLYPKQ